MEERTDPNAAGLSTVTAPFPLIRAVLVMNKAHPLTTVTFLDSLQQSLLNEKLYSETMSPDLLIQFRQGPCHDQTGRELHFFIES